MAALTSVALTTVLGTNPQTVFRDVVSGVSGLSIHDGWPRVPLGLLDYPDLERSTGGALAALASDCIGRVLLDVPMKRTGSLRVILGTTRAPSVFPHEQAGHAETTTFELLRVGLEQNLGMPVRLSVVSTTCTSSLLAIALANDLVDAGEEEFVVAGGVDVLTPAVATGFAAMRALDRLGCDPFGRSAGTSLADGAGFVCVEPAHCDRALAYVVGHCSSLDGYHPTMPARHAEHAGRALAAVLRHNEALGANLAAVATHGSGTAANDQIETALLDNQFGLGNTAVERLALKGGIGHTLGASGAIELILLLESLRSKARPQPVSGIKQAFGFGGNNCVFLVTSTPAAGAVRSTSQRLAVVSESSVNGSRFEGEPGLLLTAVLECAAQCVADVSASERDNLPVIFVTDVGDQLEATRLASTLRGNQRVRPSDFATCGPASIVDAVATANGLHGTGLVLLSSATSTADASTLVLQVCSAAKGGRALLLVGETRVTELGEHISTLASAFLVALDSGNMAGPASGSDIIRSARLKLEEVGAS